MGRCQIDIPMQAIAAFCRKWKIRELSVFGSVLREDFRPDSDVDVLVDFLPSHQWGLYDVVDMEEELTRMFGRKVDLVMKGGLKNPFRRQAILEARQVLYAA